MMKNKIKIPAWALTAACAAGLLLAAYGTIGTTRAALTYYSENYVTQLTTHRIGTTLLENGEAAGVRDYSGDGDAWTEASEPLLSGLELPNGRMEPGKTYPVDLAARNSGNIDTYVRAVVTKYWSDGNGNKIRSMDPGSIALSMPAGSGWTKDPSASTDEREILYYGKILPVDGTTPAFIDGIGVSGAVASDVTVETSQDGSVITTTTVWAADGAYVTLECEIDAVQTHSAAKAIKSAWGVDVNIGPDGSLGLGKGAASNG